MTVSRRLAVKYINCSFWGNVPSITQNKWKTSEVCVFSFTGQGQKKTSFGTSNSKSKKRQNLQHEGGRIFLKKKKHLIQHGEIKSYWFMCPTLFYIVKHWLFCIAEIMLNQKVFSKNHIYFQYRWHSRIKNLTCFM